MRYVALVCLLLLAPSLLAVEPTARPARWDEPLPDPSEEYQSLRADGYQARLKNEIAQSTTPWSGHYYQGDGLGMNWFLDLSAETGFLLLETGCGGLYGRAHGDATLQDDGSIQLEPVEERLESFAVWPVQQGNIKYLIKRGSALAFANAFNAGEPLGRGISTGSLSNDISAAGKIGVPVMAPPKLRHLFLEKPIRGRITAVGDRVETKGDYTGLVRTAATIDLGSEHGVFAGMVLYLRDPERAGEFLVRAVGSKSASGVFIASSWTADEAAASPRVGWRLSSRSASGEAHLESMEAEDADQDDSR